MSNQIVTPQKVEARLYELSHMVDEAHEQLVTAEKQYNDVKADYEIAIARSRIGLARRTAPNGKNYTVGEREDLAILENEALHRAMADADTVVKAARENVRRIRVHVDLTRSIGTSVRTSMELV